MSVLALDLSLTASGWCIYTDNQYIYGCFRPKTKGVERLAQIRDFMKSLVEKYTPANIFIEDFAYSGNRGTDMGTVQGVVRLMLYDNGYAFKLITPQHIKKYVTGDGRANKEKVINGAKNKFGICIKDNNECDAYCLAHFAIEYLPNPEVFEKKYDLHHKKSKKIKQGQTKP